MTKRKLNLPDGPARDKFTAAAEQLADDIIAMLQESVDAKKEWAVTCRYCKKSARYPFPNYEVVLKAAQFLIDNGIGKPAQQKQAPERPKADIEKAENLSDEELQARINQLREKHGKADGGAA